MFTKSQLPIIAILLYFTFSCNKEKPVAEVQNVQPENADTVVYEYLLKPDSLFRAKKFDSALIYYKQASHKYVNINSKAFLKAHNKIGRINLILRKYKEALDGLKLSDSTIFSENSLSNEVSEYFHLIGEVYFYTTQPENALKYYNLSLKLGKKAYSYPSRNNVYNYLGLGNVYCFLLYDYYNGQKYFEKALEEAIHLNDTTENEILFRCYYNLAANNRYRKNYDKAEYYAKGALEVAKGMDLKVFEEFSHTLLASLNAAKNELESSLYHLKQVGEIISSNPSINYEQLAKNYGNVGYVYNKMDSSEKSIKYYSLALELFETHQINIPDRKAEILAELGYSYHKGGNDEKALGYLLKSVSTSSQGKKDLPSIKLAYSLLGHFFKNKGQYDDAIFYFRKALDAAGFKLNQNFSNYSEGKNFIEFYETLNSLAIAKKLKALADDTIDYNLLASSLKDLVLADSLIQTFRRNNFLASDELWLSKDVQQSYTEALKCIEYLYSFQQDDIYYQTALNLMEQNKARILSKSIKKYEGLKDLGVPDSLIQYWQDLNTQISHWQNEYELTTDMNYQRLLEDRLLKAVQEFELLNKSFEERYSSYLSFRIYQIIPKINALTAYSRENKTIILSFYQGASTITVLAIGPQNSFLYFPQITSRFLENMNNYKQIITEGNALSTDDFMSFSESAFELYTSLIEPGLVNLKGIKNYQNLLIIPDQIISTIPFEAFIETKIGSKQIDYKSPKYLVKRFEIRYLPSISFLDTIHQHYHGVLSFGGWGYEKLNNNDHLPNLSFSKEELHEVSSTYKNNLFLDKKATETNFKKYAENYDLLHLSIHGTASSQSSLPALYFNQDKENDGVLYPYELYNLRLKSKLAVLSACETGKGKIYPGEGVFSIARAFFYAGCKSMVINLWNVKDNSSLKIQPYFYENLRTGLTKSSSLRNAKLKYINESDKILSHPSFWAPTILIGSNDVLYHQNEMVNFTLSKILLTISFVIVTILIAIKFWIREPKSYTQPQKNI